MKRLRTRLREAGPWGIAALVALHFCVHELPILLALAGVTLRVTVCGTPHGH